MTCRRRLISCYSIYTANLWLSDGKSYVSGQLRPLSGRTGYAFSTTGEPTTSRDVVWSDGKLRLVKEGLIIKVM